MRLVRWPALSRSSGGRAACAGRRERVGGGGSKGGGRCAVHRSPAEPSGRSGAFEPPHGAVAAFAKVMCAHRAQRQNSPAARVSKTFVFVTSALTPPRRPGRAAERAALTMPWISGQPWPRPQRFLSPPPTLQQNR